MSSTIATCSILNDWIPNRTVNEQKENKSIWCTLNQQPSTVVTNPVTKKWICRDLFLDLVFVYFAFNFWSCEFTYVYSVSNKVQKNKFLQIYMLHPFCISCLLRMIKHFSVLNDLRRIFMTLHFQIATGLVKRQVNCYWGLKHFSQHRYCGHEELTPSPFSLEKEQSSVIFSTTGLTGSEISCTLVQEVWCKVIAKRKWNYGTDAQTK